MPANEGFKQLKNAIEMANLSHLLLSFFLASLDQFGSGRVQLFRLEIDAFDLRRKRIFERASKHQSESYSVFKIQLSILANSELDDPIVGCDDMIQPEIGD